MIPGVEARLVDDDDQDVPPGAEGEILLRGDNIMFGYWRNPEATAEALRGGWFHTGDIATVDDDGYYTIVDRKKDMINAGGFKVWPREVEEVLYRHPAVQEAAVVADARRLQRRAPVAFVSLKRRAAGDRGRTDRTTAARISPPSRCRANSSSATNCRNSRPAKSFAASCATMPNHLAPVSGT